MLNRKEYMKEYNKKYYQKNKEKAKRVYAKYYQEHKEEINKYMKQYRENNFEKCRDLTMIWRKNNPERVKDINKQWRGNNIEKLEETAKAYRENYPERIREYHKTRMNIRRKTNLKVNLNHRISGAIYKSIRGNKNGRSWETIVGYTLNKLQKHLQKTMPKGYTWQDFLKAKLHIDHIIPISVFNFDKPEHTDFKNCWALKNLQLLPVRENLIKHNKLFRPFQPALKL